MKYDKLALFAGGVLFGTAGIAVLASREAKRVYTACTAAVLRGKDAVIDCYETLKENCGALIVLGVLGILPPASSALLHNGSTILTGLKSMTPLLKD